MQIGQKVKLYQVKVTLRVLRYKLTLSSGTAKTDALPRQMAVTDMEAKQHHRQTICQVEGPSHSVT